VLAALIFPLLASKLDAVLDVPQLSGATFGAVVLDEQGNVLYERNGSTRLMPASNQKLQTCAYALDRLGPEFRSQTRIWVERDRLVIDAPGDPSLSYQKLVDAKHFLRLSGKLPIYVRQAYAPGVPASWEHDDLPNRYAAPVSAFSFDQGAFELWAEKGRAFLVPQSFGVKIKRGIKTGKPKINYDWVKGTILLDGELPKERTRLDTLGLQRPDAAAASVIGRGMFPAQSVPTTTPSLTLVGDPLLKTMTTCLVKSDNNIAENLMLMAAASEGPLGDDPYATARKRMTDFLTTKAGVEAGDLRVYDGSGMSRHNLTTVRGLARLLYWESQQPTFAQWRGALADPGAGTLSTRLKDIELRAKTGTLDMVVALSGYLTAKDGKRYIFSVVLNNFTCASSAARDIADSFARTLSAEGLGTPVANIGLHDSRRHPDQEPGYPDVHRLRRPDRNRDPAPSGPNRGAQPGYAAVH
jgi:serine-type D-Ala-D-Ala carboxypeptidase/endopeptidase (penicillin-binding protein 4)